MAQNIEILYFLFLLTFYYEVVRNSRVIVIFLKEKKFIASSIQYCNCDDNNVHVQFLVYDYCHVLSPADFF